jgi:hypothetical protein
MIVIIFNTNPRCKTCGKEMQEWNPWANEHEHIDCLSERVSSILIDKLQIIDTKKN